MRSVLRSSCLLLVALATGHHATAQWGPIATPNKPSPRDGARMAFDPFGNQMLMFGGSGTNEFWSFAGATWTQLLPATAPSASLWPEMAIDSSGQLLLYGGLGTGQFALDETWHWNGITWQQLAPGATPGGRYRHGLVFDPNRQVFVLFGGRYNSWIPDEAKAETWEYAAGTWTQASPFQQPPGLCDMAMAYHNGLGKVLLFGGSDNNGIARDETWTYDGLAWTQTNTTGPRPSPRVGARMVSVQGSNSCILCGGRDPVTMAILNDTWEYDGANWVQSTSIYAGIYPPRADFALAHDLARNRLVAFGGVTANQGLRDDTWEYGAHFQPYGTGCAGTAGVPLLSLLNPPVLGALFSARLSNLPPNSTWAAVVAGFSRTQAPFGTLPHLLTYLGMPNCRLHTSSEVTFVLTPIGGIADWTWQVPLQPILIGETYHLQGVSLDPGANPLGATVSNAATMILGN